MTCQRRKRPAVRKGRKAIRASGIDTVLVSVYETRSRALRIIHLMRIVHLWLSPQTA